MPDKRVIIVGLFSDADASPVTQASVLASLLEGNGYAVIKASNHKNKWLRLLDIVYCMITKAARYDVAIVQFYSGNSFIWQYIAAKLAKLFDKKLVFTVHGGNVPARIAALPDGRYQKLLQKADVVTAPSKYMMDALAKYGIECMLVENAINLKQYRFIPKERIRPTLLWMRAFSALYNPLMAVRAVSHLKHIYPDIKMYIGGPDLGMLTATKNLITQLELDNNIEIVGFMNMEKKQQYAALCDIYLSTNKIDNAPVSFLEMQAFGLPVISTNVGGISYLIEDKINGLLVEDDNDNQMAEMVSLLIADFSLANNIINNARQSLSVYDTQEVYTKWHSLLSNL